jgi:hypothetical protein
MSAARLLWGPRIPEAMLDAVAPELRHRRLSELLRVEIGKTMARL